MGRCYAPDIVGTVGKAGSKLLDLLEEVLALKKFHLTEQYPEAMLPKPLVHKNDTFEG